MDDIGTAFTFGTLANHDEAFRISLLVLISDPGYRMLPMRQAMTIYRSIWSRNYFLMLRGSRAVGVIMWMEVSAEVENDCLSKDRSPFVDELSERSHALYCMALAATEPGAMLPLWGQVKGVAWRASGSRTHVSERVGRGQVSTRRMVPPARAWASKAVLSCLSPPTTRRVVWSG